MLNSHGYQVIKMGAPKDVYVEQVDVRGSTCFLWASLYSSDFQVSKKRVTCFIATLVLVHFPP